MTTRTKIATPNNISELRDSLLGVYANVLNREINLKEAECAANTAGKIVGTLKTQLEYHKLAKSTPDIAFIKEGK